MPYTACSRTGRELVLVSVLMSSITVYSKPACPQCTMTQKHLEKKGIEFAVIDITQDDEARAMVMSLGYSAAPVVVSGGTHFAGFRPDRLNELINS